MALRIVFMGTPDFAVPVLSEIVGQGHEIVAVYSRAPKPAGRGMELQRSPIHRLAEEFGIPVFTPKTLRSSEAVETLAAQTPDVIVVVAYGLILPKAVLDIPRSALNLHASLLPRWRGAAPIQRAIIAGDKESGVMVMRMEEGLDTGPVAMAERVAIDPETTAGELHDRLSHIGADLMVRALAAFSRGSLGFTPQAAEGVTYANKIDKTECRIDWRQPAQDVHNLIRGLSPFPGAFFEADFGRGPERVKVLRAKLAAGEGAPGSRLGSDGFVVACGGGAVQLTQLQRAGKAPMSDEEFLRGVRGAEGFLLP
ncbi:MAG TPA: methionyl-tRNA formyltransferase [Beijerinckiaceae bacterium]|nr:methionyl-tRNA formyltransferase [Beijerinckiaceae bacterium]